MSELVRRVKAEDGMSTAEYAMGTVAIAGLGGVLIKLFQQQWIKDLIIEIVKAIVNFVLHLIGVG